MAEGTKVADGVKVANQLTLNKENILDYLSGSDVITQAFRCGRGRRNCQCRSDVR